MCPLRNIAILDYRTDTHTDRQTLDKVIPVPLCFAGDTKNSCIELTLLQTIGIINYPQTHLVFKAFLMPLRSSKNIPMKPVAYFMCVVNRSSKTKIRLNMESLYY